MGQRKQLNFSQVPQPLGQIQPPPIVPGDGAQVADHETRIDALEAAGGGLAGTATITVPANSGRGAYEWSELVTATGVTASDIVICQLAAGGDADENTADFIDLVSLSATPATDAITLSLVVSTPISGAIAINWKI